MMTQIIDDIDLDCQTISDIGKKATYKDDRHPPGHIISFASDVNLIGKIWNRQLENHSQILVLSDPIEAIHPTRGPLMVSLVMGSCVCWIPTICIHFE